MKYFAVIVILLLPLIASADTIQTIATDLREDSPVPFRYGVAQDLATNIYDAQLTASYAGPASLELSIDSVIRAIGIDGTPYVGFAATDPITWLQSTIAIDPGATVSLDPPAIDFGPQPVVGTPEPSVWLLLLATLIAGLLGWRWLRPRKPPAAPVIATKYGPVTEWARRQAAINMLAEPDLRAQVYQVVLSECGGDDLRAEAEMHRRYPELYESGGDMTDDEILAALWEARELMACYVDVTDGEGGMPVANKAMRAVALLDEAIAGLERAARP